MLPALGDLNDDDYVASLLRQDARSTSTLSGLHTKRPLAAPKPNTRFLRTIIRETDSHNAALLAREAQDSRAKLSALRHSNQSSKESSDLLHRKTNKRKHEEGKSRRGRGPSNDDDGRGADNTRGADSREHRRDRPRSSRRDRYDADGESRARPSRERSPRTHRTSAKQSTYRDARNPEDTGAGRRLRSESFSDEEEDRAHASKRRRSRERSSEGYRRTQRRSSRDRRLKTGDDTRDHNHSSSRQKHKERQQHRSRSRSRSPRQPRSSHGHRRSRPVRESPSRARASSTSSSDPLDAFIGPRPVSPPAIRSKGRNAYRSSAMDSHFSSTYDPTADIQATALSDDDDWDQALEALRDRQKWKSSGADRLRAAGFTEDEVGKWERGGERGEEDVKWRKKGEGREWDRGKVLDDDGLVKVDVDWGRLKAT